jgi:hypothetical protein
VEPGAASVHVCSSGISAERYKVFWIHAVIGWIALFVLESKEVTADNHSSAQIALTFGRVPGMMSLPLVL